MRLQRKLFVKPEYYKDLGLNEYGEDWLKRKRSKLAKKYWKESRNKPPESRHKLITKLREELINAEKDISGGKTSSEPYTKKKNPDRFGRYLREAVDHEGERKKREIQDAERKLAEKLKKEKVLMKRLGKGALIAGGTALGIGLGVKTYKDYKDRKKISMIKDVILDKKNKIIK